jgi:endonuclease YncB( thermonuclease family)
MIARLAVATAAMAALVTWAALAETITGPVRPMDADTFDMAGAGVIRLADIDAPEMAQKCEGGPKELRDCGAFVADVLAAPIREQSVECEVHAIGEYERRIASCSHAGEDRSTWLVSEGLALAFRRYSERLVAEEEAARAARRGLWQTTFEPPGITGRIGGKSPHRKRPKDARSKAISTATASGSITHRGARNGMTERRSARIRGSGGSALNARRSTQAGALPRGKRFGAP